MNQPEPPATEFERKLTEALRPVDAPANLAARILAHAELQKRAALFTWPRPHLWATGALAAALLAGVFLGERQHARHEREQAALAQRQFDLAMQITGRTLEHTRQQLQDAGIQIGN